MTATTGTYRVMAVTNGDGTSTITTKQQQIRFDSSPGQGDELPGPADLLTAAFAACALKNIERFGRILGFHWQAASIHVESERQDTPPKIIRIRYRIEIVTNEPEHRLELLHRNLTKFGTIYNTLAASCEVSGDLIASPGSEPRS